MKPRLITVWLVGAAMAACTIVAFKQVPATQPEQTSRAWGVVHSLDVTAAQRIGDASSFEQAKKIGRELGYEPVEDISVVFFFPVPAWSADAGFALIALLEDALDRGFERNLSSKEFTPALRDHLDHFMHDYAGRKVGGDLGANIRNSSLGNVRLERTVDLVVRSESSEKNVSVPARELSAWLGSSTEPKKAANRTEAKYPPRKELLGLGTRGFGLALSKPTNPEVFERLLDRAKEILKKRRAENLEAISKLRDQAIAQALNGERSTAFAGGDGLDFNKLPAGMQQWFKDLASMSPEAFGQSDSNSANRYLSGATVGIAKGGFHIFVTFQLQGTGTASDGSPVTYSVAWDIGDVVGKSR